MLKRQASYLFNDNSFLLFKTIFGIYTKLRIFNFYQMETHPTGSRRYAPTLSMKYFHVLQRFVALRCSNTFQMNLSTKTRLTVFIRI